MLRSCLWAFLLVFVICGNALAIRITPELPLSKSAVQKLIQITRQKAFANHVQPHLILSKDIVTTSDIQNYLRRLDKWASFVNKDQLYRSQGIAETFSGSLGMALVVNSSGEFVCIPYPQSPAAKAGIREGDILLKANGIDLQGAPLSSVALSLAGDVGTSADLSIRRKDRPLDILVVRSNMKPPHVTFFQEPSFARIRIWSFDNNTPNLLRKTLRKVGSQPLVLDVRGNSGGHIVAALTCAAEFLPDGMLLSLSNERENSTNNGSIKTKTKKDGTYSHIFPLYIWQDSLTASSAEAFVAALVDNSRATNMGLATFGKAFIQKKFNIEGHILTLSTKALYAPSGTSWEGVGISPIIFSANTGTHALRRKTQDMLY